MSIGIPDAASQLQNQNQVYSRQRISAFPIEIREQDNISIHSMDDRASIPEQHTPQPPEQQNTPNPTEQHTPHPSAIAQITPQDPHLVLPEPLEPILHQHTIQTTVS